MFETKKNYAAAHHSVVGAFAMPVVLALLLLLILPAGVAAQEVAPALRGSAGLVLQSDDRLRGVSQSNLLPAAGASLGIEHRSGVYLSGTVTSVAGWGSVGGAPVRLRLSGGYRAGLGGAQLEARVVGTLFPGGGSSFVELGGSVSGFIGPLSLTGSLAWAPPQAALGNWSGTPESRPGATGSNLYLAADAGLAVIGTPLTLTGHVGHSQGSEGLGPDNWALSPTGAYWDWRLGIDYGLGAFSLGLAWVATDIGTNSLAWRQLQPAFSAGGGAPGGSGFIVSLSAAF
jgi:uncharacterized protein (TIGR02001 family)